MDGATQLKKINDLFWQKIPPGIILKEDDLFWDYQKQKFLRLNKNIGKPCPSILDGRSAYYRTIGEGTEGFDAFLSESKEEGLVLSNSSENCSEEDIEQRLNEEEKRRQMKFFFGYEKKSY